MIKRKAKDKTKDSVKFKILWVEISYLPYTTLRCKLNDQKQPCCNWPFSTTFWTEFNVKFSVTCLNLCLKKRILIFLKNSGSQYLNKRKKTTNKRKKSSCYLENKSSKKRVYVSDTSCVQYENSKLRGILMLKIHYPLFTFLAFPL